MRGDDLQLTPPAKVDSDRSRGMQTLLATKLDDDPCDDLIIAGTVNAVVYYGTTKGLDIKRAFLLPADNCQGIAAHDLNGDGRPEILLANQGHQSSDGHQHAVSPSTIFWATEQGYDSQKRTELPTLSATAWSTFFSGTARTQHGTTFPPIFIGVVRAVMPLIAARN